ncbi:MAG: formylglycine-generating enzyme family protein [Bacteroidota bacterium]
MKFLFKYFIVYLLSHSINAQTLPIIPSKPELVFVKGGKFEKGDKSSGEKTESFILSDYYIGTYEVTVAQYRAFCEEMGRDMPKQPKDGGLDNHPIVNVSYFDAMEYCDWLSEKFGGIWRLPTDTEWEYAARGGIESKGYIYSGSNKVDQVSWNTNNSDNGVQSVGLKMPNELGIYDMTGNASEWVLDWHPSTGVWGSYLDVPERKKNPIGPPLGYPKRIRGRDFHFPERSTVYEYSFNMPEDTDRFFGGFRIARNIDGDNDIRYWKYDSYLVANTRKIGVRPCDERDLGFLGEYIYNRALYVRTTYPFQDKSGVYLKIGYTNLNRHDEILEILALMSCVTPKDVADGKRDELVAEYWNNNEEIFFVYDKSFPVHILVAALETRYDKLLDYLFKINGRNIKSMDLSRAVSLIGSPGPYTILDYADIKKAEWELEMKKNSNESNKDYYLRKIATYSRYIPALEKFGVTRLR